MNRRAFTLLELLVTIAILGILSTLILRAIGNARKAGALAREINAGRQLVAAYVRSATDRNGEFMVGYAANESALDDKGEEVPNPACGRYPWRLAPYLDYKLRGTVLVNEQEEIAKSKDHGDYVYRASANPSFGINATFVGGNERTGIIPSPATIKRYGRFVATRLAEVSQPSKLLVFASARYSEGKGGARDGEDQPGFHLVTPPRTAQTQWSGNYDESAPAQEFGFLHLRHSKRAVCAMLGGNVELLDEKQVQDMRYWSHLAAEADNPDFTLTKIQ